MRAWILGVGALLAAAGCELREITFAPARDVVVAEVILHANRRLQTAYLHRTATADHTARVFNARVFVIDEERNLEVELLATDDSLCLTPTPPAGLPAVGSCHAAMVPPDLVRPGASYALRIELQDRPHITGRTQVPGAFGITQPAAAECRLDPATPLPLAWTASSGAWVYLTQARFTGLLAALARQGVPPPPALSEPVDLLGLAIGAADTTLLFPSGFGIFDRADEDLHPVLVAIADGLPPDVDAQIAVAAADRNYVNWVRGGTFNPSGTVRVPSLGGGGTGVFGALVTRALRVHTGATGAPCSGSGVGPD